MGRRNVCHVRTLALTVTHYGWNGWWSRSMGAQKLYDTKWSRYARYILSTVHCVTRFTGAASWKQRRSSSCPRAGSTTCVHRSRAIIIQAGGVCKGGLEHWGNLQGGNIQYTKGRCDMKMWCEVNYKVYTIICLLLLCFAEGCRPSWIWVSWASLFSHASFSVQGLWGCCQGVGYFAEWLVLVMALLWLVGFGVLCHWLVACVLDQHLSCSVSSGCCSAV